MKYPNARLTHLALVLLLAACGGGGGGGSTPPAPPPAQPPVVLAPTASQVSTNAVAAGQSFVLTGTGLLRVTAASLGASALTLEAQSDTQLTLRLPANAVSGLLSLSWRDASNATQTLTTAFTVSGFLPATVSGFSPSAGVAGTAITVTGSNLDGVRAVLIAGSELVVQASSASQFTFIIPANASTGALQLRTAFETVAVGTLTVVPALAVSSLNALVSTSNTQITVRGSGLTQVQSVQVNGTTVPFTLSSDSELLATAPAPLEGEVRLITAAQTLRAGDFTRGSSATLSLADLRVAQLHALSPSTAGMRLVENKPMLVRVALTTSASNVPSPRVELIAVRDGADAERLSLVGPSIVPRVAPDVHLLSGSYQTTVAAAQVRPGTRWRLEVTPAGGGAAVISSSIETPIDAAPRMLLTLVPLVVGGRTPVLPTPSEVRAVLLRTMPLRDVASLQIKVRASAFTPTGISATPTNDDIDKVLDQLDDLRAIEEPRAIWYGFGNTDVLYRAELGGLAYRNDLNGLRSGFAATTGLGEDVSRNGFISNPFAFIPLRWAETMVHELGHILTRRHAPCSGAAPVGNPDPSFPYAGGTLGNVPLYDEQTRQYVLSTTSGSSGGAAMSDVMGYCNGHFFSDYNYRAVHEALQAHGQRVPVSSLARPMQLAPFAAPLQVLNLAVRAGRVELLPMRLAEAAPLQTEGSHELLLHTRDGAQLRLTGQAIEVVDGPQRSYHLRVAVPAGTVIERLQLREHGESVASLEAPALLRKALAATGAPRISQIDGAAGRRTRLDWDASAYPSVDLIHEDSEGQRKVLGLRLSGGQAELADLPRTGTLWLDLRGPWAARRVQLQPARSAQF